MAFNQKSYQMKSYYKMHREEYRLFIQFDYEEAKLNAVRAIEGRRYSRTESCWHFPIDRGTWYQLIEIFPWLKDSIRPEFHKLKKEEIGPVEPDELFDYEEWKSREVRKRKRVYHKALSAWQRKVVADLEEQLILKRYSKRTITVYLSSLTLFLLYTKKSSMEDVGKKDVEAFLRYMYKEKNISESYMNQIINAIKAYYEKVLGWPKMRFDIARPKRPVKVIKPLTKEEIERFFSVIDNLKHKCLMMLIYSSGLRISEACSIRVKDILFSRKMVFISRSKGKRDRYSVLADSMIPIIKAYLKEYKPRHHLFEGSDRRFPYSSSSARRVFQRAKQKSGIHPDATVHTLRHSFATHSMENGMSLSTIKELLGHRDIKTTAKYLYVSSETLKRAKSPLDGLDIKTEEEDA